MALKEKIQEHVTPFLDPDERIESVFLARTGPSPYWSLLSGLFYFWVKNYVVAATDRRIAVFRAGTMNTTKPKEQVASLPRNSLSEGLSGRLWGRIDLGGTRYWVNRRFRQDVEVAVSRFANPS